MCYVQATDFQVWASDLSCDQFAVEDVGETHCQVSLRDVNWADSAVELVAVEVAAPDMARVHAVVDRLQLCSTATLAATADTASHLSVVARGVEKLAGTRVLCEKLGYFDAFIVGVGDSGNDETLLAGSDVSVAVAGSTAARLSGIDHLIESPAVNGWCELVDIVSELISSGRAGQAATS